MEILCTNHYTIPAICYFNNLYKVIIEITKNENSTDTIKSTNKKFTKDINIYFSRINLRIAVSLFIIEVYLIRALPTELRRISSTGIEPVTHGLQAKIILLLDF